MTFPTYPGALVREFRTTQGLKYHPIHGLVEFKAKSDQIYPIECLGPSIQLFKSEGTRYYFNPYINYQAFNDIWDPEYFSHGVKLAKRVSSTRKRKTNSVNTLDTKRYKV
jgi:hypothetical protein